MRMIRGILDLAEVLLALAGLCLIAVAAKISGVSTGDVLLALLVVFDSRIDRCSAEMIEHMVATGEARSARP